MGADSPKARLKRQLLAEVRRLCRRDRLSWKRPILDTLFDLKSLNVEAVFFGGTLRSLLVSRVFERRPGRPRDIDIVVAGASLDTLREYFSKILARQTRFGGLHLRRREWQFDVWPVNGTWAFQRDAGLVPGFAALPSTTFLNLEAIAVDVWPGPGRRSRVIYSGDDQFFDGIVSRTLEINREENPFPDLCVLRALVMAADLQFSIGARLAAYIVRHGEDITASHFDDLQEKHYGRLRVAGETLRRWVEGIVDLHREQDWMSIDLPSTRQLPLWPEADEEQHVRLLALSESAGTGVAPSPEAFD
jgi:hypothetical protein